MRFIILFLLFIGLSIANLNHLKCLKDTVVQYEFVSDVSSLGSKDGERLSVKGTVDVQCVKKEGFNEYFVGTPDVSFAQKIGGKRYEKSYPGTPEYSVFTLNQEGLLLQFINSHEPNPAKKVEMVLYNVRKTVASFYQIDTTKGKHYKRRVENSPEGQVNARYTYSRKRGHRRIVRRVKSRDVIKLLGAQKLERKRDSKFRLTTACLIKEGIIQRVNQRYFAVFGTNSKGNKQYEELKVAHPEMKPDAANEERAGDIQKVESATRFILKKKITKKDVDAKTLDVTTGFAEDLSMSQATYEFALQAKKEKLEQSTDYPQILRKLQENPKNIQVFNKALEYTKAFSEKSLSLLIKEYKAASNNLAYQKVLHTLLASTQSPVAEKVLIEALKNPVTTQSAMTSMVGIKSPSDESIHALQALSEAEELGVLSSQAYLLFAHMASKTQNKLLAQHILGHVAMNMHNVLNKAEGADSLNIHVKALANAGEAVPLSILEKLIYSNHMSLDSRIDAAHALQHRTAEHEHEEATSLVHKIVQSDIHEEVKTAAIHAQTQREKVLENRASVDEFRKLEATSESGTILSAISDYFTEADVQQTEVEDAENEDMFKNLPDVDYNHHLQERNVLFFRKIGRAIKRGARAISRGVRKAYRAVKKTAIRITPKPFKQVLKKAIKKAEQVGKKIGKFVKKAANAVKNALGGLIKKAKKFFKDLKEKIAGKVTLESLGKTCIDTTRNDKICTSNKHYMNYARSVDRKFRFSSFSSSNQRNFEKVFGIRLLYVYFGAHGFSASKQPTKCSDSNLKFIAMARGDLDIGLFGRRFSLFSADAYIYIDKSAHGNKKVQDKFRLTLMGKLHMWELQLVPDKMKNFEYCNGLEFAMLDETFDFFELKMTIMAGPIPITFSFAITGGFALNYNLALCGESSVFSLEVEPEFTLGPTVSAGIGVAIFSGGISGELTTGIGLSHQMAQTQCNRCVQQTLSLFPLTFTLGLYLDLLVTRFERTLYEKKIGKGKKWATKKCMDESKANDWDPEEGVTPATVKIERMKFSNNLLLNMAFMKTTQKVWIKIVKLFLQKYFKNLRPSGRKGKGGKSKRGKSSKRRSKSGKKRRSNKKRSNKKKQPRKRPQKRSNKKKNNKNKKKDKKKKNKKEKKDKGDCLSKADNTLTNCQRIAPRASFCEANYFKDLVKCPEASLHQKCMAFFTGVKRNEAEGEKFCQKFTPDCEESDSPLCLCDSKCRSILKLLGSSAAKRARKSSRSSRKSSKKSSGRRKKRSSTKRKRQNSKGRKGSRKVKVIKVRQNSRKSSNKRSKRTPVLSVEPESLRVKDFRRNF